MKKTTLAAMTALAVILTAQNSALAAPGGIPQGSITLRDFNVALCYHNNTVWGLTKDVAWAGGSSGPMAWVVTATKGNTTPNEFTVYGYLTVENTGSGIATIGNIVVNLQKSPGSCQTPSVPWVSAAANVSAASGGDSAQVANIVAAGSQESQSVNACSGLGSYTTAGSVGTFSESAGSGALQFFNSQDNTIWALTNPADRTLAPGQIVNLLYKATFTASAPGMPAAGEPIRIETLVTFGNAGARGGSGASVGTVDIDMDGAVNGQPGQTDEDNVRTVPTRSTTTMPGLQNCNSTVTLTDDGPTLTPDSGVNGSANTVTTTTSPLPTINEAITATTTETLGIDVAGGSNGGQVCNEAKLTGSDYNLTLTIFTNGALTQVYEPCCVAVGLAAHACATVDPEVQGCTLCPGTYCGFTQGGWGATPNGNNVGAILAAGFNTVYGANGVTVGGAKTMTFKTATTTTTKKVKGKIVTTTVTLTGPQAIELYLPAGKTAGQLTASLVNPDKSSAGVFGGQVLALQLNVDFSAAGVNPTGLGGVKYCGTDLPSETGLTISQILAQANAVLGGATTASAGLFQQDGTTPMTVAQVNDLITNFNEAFDNCSLTQWAADHLCAP